MLDANVLPNLVLLASGLSCADSAALRTRAHEIVSRIPRERIEADYDYLLRRSVDTRTTPMLCHLAEELTWLQSNALSELNSVAQATQKALFANAFTLLKELQNSEIQFALIKGSDYVWSIYPRDLPRQMADIDIIIKPTLIDDVTHTACSIGFFQGAFDRNTLLTKALSAEELRQFKENHYELPPFLKLVEVPELFPLNRLIETYFVPRDYILTAGDTVYVLVQVDAHFNLSFDIKLDHVWHDTRRLNTDSGSYVGLSWETNIWFLAARTYIETTVLKSSSLRSFIDLTAVIARTPNIDWSHIEKVAREYRLFFPFLYVFSHVEELVPCLIPPSFLEFCRRECVARLGDQSDNGDFFASLLDSIGLHQIHSQILPQVTKQ